MPDLVIRRDVTINQSFEIPPGGSLLMGVGAALRVVGDLTILGSITVEPGADVTLSSTGTLTVGGTVGGTKAPRLVALSPGLHLNATGKAGRNGSKIALLAPRIVVAPSGRVLGGDGEPGESARWIRARGGIGGEGGDVVLYAGERIELLGHVEGGAGGAGGTAISTRDAEGGRGGPGGKVSLQLFVTNPQAVTTPELCIGAGSRLHGGRGGALGCALAGDPGSVEARVVFTEHGQNTAVCGQGGPGGGVEVVTGGTCPCSIAPTASLRAGDGGGFPEDVPPDFDLLLRLAARAYSPNIGGATTGAPRPARGGVVAVPDGSFSAGINGANARNVRILAASPAGERVWMRPGRFSI